MEPVAEKSSAIVHSDIQRSEATSRLVNVKVRTSKNLLEPFDRQKISDSLVKETGVRQKVADEIAAAIEEEMANMKLKYVTAPLISELVNVKLGFVFI